MRLEQKAEIGIWPYARGYVPRDTMYQLWQIAEVEGYNQRLWGADNGNTPISTAGDLVGFVTHFMKPDRILLVPHIANEIMGFVWFDRVKQHERAFANIFYRRRFWGHRAREATRKTLAVMFESFGLKEIWGLTPNHLACRHAEATGLRKIGQLPDIADGRPLDAYRITREEWING